MGELLDRLRPEVFWGVDRFRGGSVRRALAEIRSILADPGSPEALRIREANLVSLLDHARSTTPFYRALGHGRDLADFPVITKDTIRAEPDAFLSEAFRGRRLYSTTTSGSTGTPFTVLQDAGKRTRHQADNLHFCAQAGYPFGSRLYYLRVWNRMNHKSRLVQFMQNLVPVEIGDLSDGPLEALVEALRKDRGRKSLLGYGSSLEALGQYLERHGVHPRTFGVRAILAMSETLPESRRAFLREAFDCPVTTRYSNMENGFIAQQCAPDGTEYHLNLASYHIELLAFDRDEPAGAGELGRIVVTDLFNRAMPLIRYDTGDAAEQVPDSVCGAPGPVFRKVEGRRVDFLYDVRGHRLSPGIILNTLWKYNDIKQFQFIQTGEGTYTIKVNCGHPAYARSQDLVADLRSFLGEEARVTLELEEGLPLLASGKRKSIISHWSPS